MYSRNGHICILVCKMYQICANHAKSVNYFLVLKEKMRGNWSLFLCKVCCPCASLHYWPPDPHENLLIYLLQYNSWLKSVRGMTQFWLHPPLIVEMLAHQSHFQSTFNAHQSECMNNTTKLILKYKKLETTPFVYSPSMQNSGENPPKSRPNLASLGVEPTTVWLKVLCENLCFWIECFSLDWFKYTLQRPVDTNVFTHFVQWMTACCRNRVIMSSIPASNMYAQCYFCTFF